MKEILCSFCGHDLTISSNSIDYRILLKRENIPPCDGAVTDMAVYQEIEEDKHFCGLGCLKEWIV